MPPPPSRPRYNNDIETNDIFNDKIYNKNGVTNEHIKYNPKGFFIDVSIRIIYITISFSALL